MSTTSSSPAAPLLPIIEAFEAEIDAIASIYSSCQGHRSVLASPIQYVPTEDGCLVALWDAWNRFIRQLLLTSAAGPVQGLSGTAYSPSAPMTEPAALAHLRANKKGTRIVVIAGEPKWFDVAALPDLASVLGVGNQTVIVSAVTSSTIQLGRFTVDNPLEEVRVCRNMVAHKCAGTVAEASRFAAGPFTSMTSHVRSRRFGVEVFHEWIDGCRALALAAAQ